MEETRKFGLREILFMPLGCLLQSSPVIIILLVVILIFAGDYIYYNLNITIPGYAAPDTSTWNISNGFETINNEDGFTWEISYENVHANSFNGLVRHASPIRENKFPMLSHDILITSGDFADPDLVNTSVSNHHFIWRSTNSNYPKGTINLLHTVPLNNEIRQQLTTIRSDHIVHIQGREIYDIRFYKDEQKWNSKWQDAGCNTLLVTSVEIVTP